LPIAHADPLVNVLAMRHLRSRRCTVALALCGLLLAGCGKSARSRAGAGEGASGGSPSTASLATKNTTRLGDAEPASDAAAVARAVYPGLTPATRPQAVVLVDERAWPAALAAATLAAAPLGAPLLYADGNALPAVSLQALEALHPTGAPALGGAQVIRVGTSASVPGGYRTQTLAGGEPAAVAAAVEQLGGASSGAAPRQVIVTAADGPAALAMPAAGLSAESAAPILLVTAAGVPTPTATVLARLRRPTIYVVGLTTADARAQAALTHFGTVKPIVSAGTPSEASGGPVENAIAVSRYADGSFGWGIHEAGHGLVFALSSRPLDAPAAAPLAAHGDYGPLLLLEGPSSLAPALVRYLSDIQPGYTAAVPPVRGFYNHGWLIGDEISAVTQARLDALLEISPSKAPDKGSSAVEEEASEAPTE
jgi:hypothetical protein